MLYFLPGSLRARRAAAAPLSPGSAFPALFLRRPLRPQRSRASGRCAPIPGSGLGEGRCVSGSPRPSSLSRLSLRMRGVGRRGWVPWQRGRQVNEGRSRLAAVGAVRGDRDRDRDRDRDPDPDPDPPQGERGLLWAALKRYVFISGALCLRETGASQPAAGRLWRIGCLFTPGKLSLASFLLPVQKGEKKAVGAVDTGR